MSTSTLLRYPKIRTELPGPKGREIVSADARWVTPSYPRPAYQLVANSASVGAYLQEGLRRLMSKHDCIGDVRGFGLMVGCEFVTDRASREPAPELRDRVEVECYRRGLILLGAGYNTIRWSPPLILTHENVDVALEIFDESIAAAVHA